MFVVRVPGEDVAGVKVDAWVAYGEPADTADRYRLDSIVPLAIASCFATSPLAR
jgi:hypothetical protein